MHNLNCIFRRKSFSVKCYSTKSSIFNWSVGVANVAEEVPLEVLRSSPNRSRSDLGGQISPSSSGSPPGPLTPSRNTPGRRNRRRRRSQFHCENAGCRTHFQTRGLRDRHMRDCQYRASQVQFYI